MSLNMKINTLYKGDGYNLLRNISSKSIDAIISDWPFYKVVNNQWDNQWLSKKDYLLWCEKIIKEYKRIIKKNGNLFIFTSRQYNKNISTILDNFFLEKRIIIWARKRNFNNTRGRALSSGYEPISYYCNGKNGTFNNIKIKSNSKRKEYKTGILKNGVSLSDVWTDIPALSHNSKEKVNHPTQKPLSLLERIVTIGTNENDLILDNFAGSGTTGIACHNLNRNFILIEKEEEYCNTIKERFKKLNIELFFINNDMNKQDIEDKVNEAMKEENLKI